MSRTGISFLTIVTACAFFGACGSSDIRPTKKTTVRSGSKYSYEYSENGCSTGRQTFYTLEEYCKGLKDDGLNQYCAASMRREAHQKNCNDY